MSKANVILFHEICKLKLQRNVMCMVKYILHFILNIWRMDVIMKVYQLHYMNVTKYRWWRVRRNLFKQCRGGGSGRHAVFPNKTELNTNVLVHGGVRLFLRALII